MCSVCHESAEKESKFFDWKDFEIKIQDFSQSHAVYFATIAESFDLILVTVIMTFLPFNCWYYSPKNKSLSNFIFHWVLYLQPAEAAWPQSFFETFNVAHFLKPKCFARSEGKLSFYV